MAKKKEKKQDESRQLQVDNKETDRLMREPIEIEPLNLATFAVSKAVEARVLSLVRCLFPILERIEAGENVTEKEILDTLSSIRIGTKTALEKLSYLRNQQ